MAYVFDGKYSIFTPSRTQRGNVYWKKLETKECLLYKPIDVKLKKID